MENSRSKLKSSEAEIADDIKSECFETESNISRDETPPNATKCGDIIVLDTGVLMFSCYFCNKYWNKAEVFTNHLYKMHLDIRPDQSELFAMYEVDKVEESEEESLKEEELAIESVFVPGYDMRKRKKHVVEDRNPAKDKRKRKESKKVSKKVSVIALELEKVDDDTEYKNEDQEEEAEAEAEAEDSDEDWVTQNSEAYNSNDSESNEFESVSTTCRFCNKTFKYPSRRIDHERVHTGEKPFACLMCPSRFRLKRQQASHMASHGDSIFCKICNEKFEDLRTLEEHRDQKHGEETKNPDVDSQGEAPEDWNEDSSNWEKMDTEGFDAPATNQEDIYKKDFNRTICKFCGKRSRNPSRREVHERIHKEETPYACSYCPKKFEANAKLVDHLAITHGISYACTYCPRKFSNPAMLEDHNKIYHHEIMQKEIELSGVMEMEVVEQELVDDGFCDQKGNDPKMCRFCGKRFPVPSKKVVHERTHTGETPFACPICPKRFKENRRLKGHLKLHPKEFQCDICSEEFWIAKDLEEHNKKYEAGSCADIIRDPPEETEKIRIAPVVCESEDGLNTDPNSRSCSYCDRTFLYVSRRIHHELGHLGKSPYACPHCPKRFQVRSYLNDHIGAMHNNIRRYKCTYCPSAFRYRCNLEVHKRIHLGDKRFPCSHCGKRFIRSTERNSHELIHTGEKNYQCEVCGKSYRCASALTNHKAIRHYTTKSFICEVCDKAFSRKENLKNHMTMHSDERPFHCSVCDASFSRKKAMVTHMKLHSTVKEYVCQVCGKEYAQYAGLYGHMKTHGIKKGGIKISPVNQTME